MQPTEENLMRRISRCLNTRLIDICQRTLQLEELNLKLNLYLDDTLKPHCHAGSFTKGCLIMVADDAVWAAQLRYSLPDLRDKLRLEAGIYQLTSIKVTIASNNTPKEKIKAKNPGLSDKAKESIISSSEQCSYEPLKQALERLAGDPSQR